jgi:small subunit ribosomal protein S13
MRLAGVNIPDDKRIDISLTYIYGIGRSNVREVLEKAQIEPTKRAKTLTEEETNRILKVLDGMKIEGDLRAEIKGNIDQLRQLKAYTGIRHMRNLPVHGQRTRSNARTKRGKRVTIGAIKKEVAEKMAAAAAKK